MHFPFFKIILLFLNKQNKFLINLSLIKLIKEKTSEIFFKIIKIKVMKTVSKYSDSQISQGGESMLQNNNSVEKTSINNKASLKKIKNNDYYNTANLPVLQKVEFYESKVAEIKVLKNNHKTEIQTIKSVKNSTQNVLNFRLDEVTKKMKSEIFRLSEESRRHEESQKSENQKIQNQINYISENCEGLDKLLNGKFI